jgi:hypothetical protein
MHSRLGRFVLLSLATLSLAGCNRPPPDPRVGAPRGEIAIRVANRSVSDLVIDLLEDGLRTRLGTAYGGMTAVFFVPWERVHGSGTLQLLADPVGSSQVVVTDRLSVRPGSMVVWTIEPVLAQSSAAVY